MAIAMGVGVHGAVAQADNPLPWDDLTEPAAYVTFDVEDTNWTLYPVITADDTFLGFFGYMPNEFVVGDNVSLLWLTPDNGDGTWSMYGWSHTDLKVVSQYLDQITNTPNVLADTGLDVFAGDPQPITEPQTMPFGIAEDDPAAPIVEATQDPVIADALISVGAAGAPALAAFANLPPVPVGCDDISAHGGDSPQTQLDMVLAWRSRVVQEVLTVWLSDEILDSLEATGLDADDESLRCNCTPIDNEIWGPWSDWNCSAGPFSTVGGMCEFTDCTRTRSGWHVVIDASCNFSRTPINDSQTQSVTVPVGSNGLCPPDPN